MTDSRPVPQDFSMSASADNLPLVHLAMGFAGSLRVDMHKKPDFLYMLDVACIKLRKVILK